MNSVAWIILGWAIVNGALMYVLGRCHGWLKCSSEYTQPALDGWRESNDAWGETIAELAALTVTNPSATNGGDR